MNFKTITTRLLNILKQTGLLFKDSFLSWSDRQPFRSSAVISYYAIFSLPGILVIIINLAGYFLGEGAVAKEISTQISGMIGPKTAETVERIIANVYMTEAFTLSSIISVVVLFFGATGLFYHVQISLHSLWKVKPKPKRIFLKYLKDRFFAFLLMLGFGFLLPISLIFSSVLSATKSWITTNLFKELEPLFYYIDLGISLGLITILFGAIYVILPDARVRWRDTWPGAFLASILFMIAKFALGLYFAYSNPGSTYGAAGSIILLMLWTNYNALILLYGAEFTRLFAERFGQKIISVEDINRNKDTKDVKADIGDARTKQE
ncbi:MAG: YihY/virulence factor BrkB family protein [Calditrichaceae bacterium]|nr:YihY/virulence factor BrkB family protein [Calditrichaceae bacterium]MBN2707576.1 YihY/virulence factor BrkB family protein [Calditrichaceae bacterium]